MMAPLDQPAWHKHSFIKFLPFPILILISISRRHPVQMTECIELLPSDWLIFLFVLSHFTGPLPKVTAEYVLRFRFGKLHFLRSVVAGFHSDDTDVAF